MKTKTLLTLNSIWLMTIGALFIILAPKISTNTFPGLETYFELIAMHQVLGVSFFNLGSGFN